MLILSYCDTYVHFLTRMLLKKKSACKVLNMEDLNVMGFDVALLLKPDRSLRGRYRSV